MDNPRHGFTLIELLITIAIIAILAAVVGVMMYPNYQKARDARRKIEIQEAGKLLVPSCYIPNAGPGDYDLQDVAVELAAKNPRYASALSQVPRDPAKGTDTQSFYRYAVNASRRCALYANLENEDDLVTLPGTLSPAPGGGTGVLQATSTGWNGSTKYYEFSN